MKPNCAGVWEWFDEKGIKRLVEVVDCGTSEHQYLNVYWWGGYYTINDDADEIYKMEAEWPDRWGNRVGDNHSIPEDQLYLFPTKDELDRIDEIDKISG